MTIRRHARPALLAALLAGPAASAGPGDFDVYDHGAAGDGETPDTGAINRAIAACAEAGGGRVVLPAGTYRSGTVELKSGVTLELEAGARLVGTDDLGAYRHFEPPEGTPEARQASRWHRALILGVGVEDAAITGRGVIDGDDVYDPRGEAGMRGPHAVLLGRCRDVAISGVTIRDAANYAILLEGSERIDIDDVTVTGGWDAVHFRGFPGAPCRDLTITDCRFFTGDDCIAGRGAERVLVAETIINTSCNGIRIIGPTTGLAVHGCLFFGPGRYPHRASDRHNMLGGIVLQPGAWNPTDGRLDDVLLSDLTMRNVAAPVHVALFPDNTAGRVRVERLSASGVYRAACSFESWADEPIGSVVLSDVSIEYNGGGTRNAADRPVRRAGKGVRRLPAWGFYARNVEEVRLEDVRLATAEADRRPVLRVEDVERLVLDDLAIPPRPDGAAAPFVLDEVGTLEDRDGAIGPREGP